MIISIDLSQEILALDVFTAFKIVFEASSQAYCAIFTTIYGPGFIIGIQAGLLFFPLNEKREPVKSGQKTFHPTHFHSQTSWSG